MLGILVIGGEILFRAIYTSTWYEEFNADHIEHITRISDIPLNSRGLRDDDYFFPKGPDTFRILVLGDSFTFGTGIKNRDDLYTNVLERKLNKSNIFEGKKRFEVLNGGLQNKITNHWVELLQSEVITFQPDMVVAVFSLRDGCKYSSLMAVFRKTQREIKQKNEKLWLYRHSHLFRFIKNRIDMKEISRRHIQAFNSWYVGSPEQTKEWENAKKNLLKMREIASQNNATFLLVIFPILFEPTDNYPFSPIMDAIQNFAEENDFDYFSLFDSFKGKSGPSLWVSKYDQHPNERGHAIAANAIYSYLFKKLQADYKKSR